MMKISEKLKLARAANNFTQAKLAEITGINHSALRKYEIDINIPGDEHLKKMAHALNLPVEALKGFENLSKIETQEKFLALILNLAYSNFIQLDFKDNQVFFSLSPTLNNYLSLVCKEQLKNVDENKYQIKTSKTDDLIEWVNTFNETKELNENDVKKISELKEKLERLEFKLLSK